MRPRDCKKNRQTGAIFCLLSILIALGLFTLALILPFHSAWAAPNCASMFKVELDADLSTLRANTNEIDKVVMRDMPKVEAVFRQILRKYPMNDHEFVLVGRSPSLLYAYIEAQAETFRGLDAWVLPVSLKGEAEVSRRDLLNRFFDLFERYRGQKASRGKKLVFVDLIAEGRTFSALEKLLIDSGIEGDLAGLTHDPELAQARLRGLLEPQRLSLFEIDSELDFAMSQHKIFAPYESHKIEARDYESSLLSAPPLIPTYLYTLIKVRQYLEE